MKILVVDDLPEMIEMIRMNLELVGHTVMEAKNAPEAIGLMSTEQFDLIITDHQMGRGGDGLTVAQHAQKLSPLPLVIWSSSLAISAPNLVLQVQETGALTVFKSDLMIMLRDRGIICPLPVAA
ncbi:MAG: response regulator [Candidatus Pacebacteria bacterium]|nr:response regulator [Candidatus Paceibacterota bacterium]